MSDQAYISYDEVITHQIRLDSIIRIEKTDSGKYNVVKRYSTMKVTKDQARSLAQSLKNYWDTVWDNLY